MKIITLKLFGILCILNFAFLNYSQSEDDGQIDSVSIKLFWSFQENQPKTVEFHLVKREDLTHLIGLFKEKMSAEEVDMAFSEIDSIPEKESKKWYEKFYLAREAAEGFSIDWKVASYLSSEIEYKLEEMVKITTAKVKARFECDNRMYYIEYDVVKMPRTWVFGNTLNIREEERDE